MGHCTLVEYAVRRAQFYDYRSDKAQGFDKEGIESHAQ